MEINTILLIILLIVLFAIFLMIALRAKKVKRMTAGHEDEKNIEPQKQESSPEEPRKIDESGKVSFISGTNISSDVKYVGNSIKEINNIDQKIRERIEKLRTEHSKEDNEFRGLYITEKEVNAILQSMTYGFEAKSEKEKHLRIDKLQKIFHLDTFEVETLLICLAAELDMRYQKLYSYLQNDITKKMPSVDMVISLLCSSVEEKLRAREYFSSNSNLIRNRLILFTGDGQEGQIPLLSRSIKIDERIVAFLLNPDESDRRIEIDRRIRHFSSIIKPERSFDELLFPENEKNTIQELINYRQNIKYPLFFFLGAYGTGRKMTAEIICGKLKRTLLVVDSKVLLKGDSMEILRIIIREACLQNSLLYIKGFEALVDKEAGVDITGFFQELDLFPNWLFLSGELPYMPLRILTNHIFIEMPFPIPSFTFRKKLWESLIDEKVPDLDIDALAGNFNFSAGQIEDAFLTAQDFATVRNPAEIKMIAKDIYRGCKAQSNKNLSSFAKNIPPRYTWDDIVLPKDLREQLKEVSGYIKHKGKVYTDWGFDTKLSLGKGLNVLFSGPSGAGKTMAAEVIAKEAGLDIYKIDLSTVVSKYIGETEKILKKIFLEAETSNAILFFDEADALFGKRSEVKDSHDRYANIEINYLLQKMEEHEGNVILASNFKTNIDEAFLRRMHFVIEFPLPDDKLRETIWRNIFPEESPVNKPLFYMCDIKDAVALEAKLRDAKDPVSRYILGVFSSNMQQLIGKSIEAGAIQDLKIGLVEELNKLISDYNMFDDQLFSQVKVREDTKRLLKKNPDGDERILLNRLLLEDAYPQEIGRCCIDFNFLSKFKLTGGNIKNIALSAAFLAAEDSCAIRMEQIIRATKREFQKIGRLCTSGDFGEYYELVK